MNEDTIQHFNEIVEKMAELAVDPSFLDGDSDQWIRGSALDIIEAFLNVNEGICELGDESREAINSLMYDLLWKPVGDKAIELHRSRQ